MSPKFLIHIYNYVSFLAPNVFGGVFSLSPFLLDYTCQSIIYLLFFQETDFWSYGSGVMSMFSNIFKFPFSISWFCFISIDLTPGLLSSMAHNSGSPVCSPLTS